MTAGPRGPTEGAEGVLDLRTVEARLPYTSAPLPVPDEFVLVKLAALEREEATKRVLLVHCRALRAALEEAKQTHLVVEDCWYSCPKAVDDRGRSRCCHDAISEGTCNCGADQHNAKIDAVLRGAQDQEE